MRRIGYYIKASVAAMLINVMAVMAQVPEFTNSGYIAGYGAGYYNNIFWAWPQWIYFRWW
jgi:hypothetical protein